MVVLTQVDDLLDDLGISNRRPMQRCTRAVLEAFQALVFVASLPPIKDVAADAVVAARGREFAADLFCVLQRSQAAVRPSDQIFVTPTRSAMRLLLSGAQTVNNLSQF